MCVPDNSLSLYRVILGQWYQYFTTTHSYAATVKEVWTADFLAVALWSDLIIAFLEASADLALAILHVGITMHLI